MDVSSISYFKFKRNLTSKLTFNKRIIMGIDQFFFVNFENSNVTIFSMPEEKFFKIFVESFFVESV